MEKKARAISPLIKVLFLSQLLILISASLAHAGSMPWETPLQAIVSSLTGNTAKAIGILSVVVGGIGFALTENNGGLAKVFRVSLALGTISSAAKIVKEVFNYISS